MIARRPRSRHHRSPSARSSAQIQPTGVPSGDERTGSSTRPPLRSTVLGKVVAALTAFGVLSAIGAYYVPGVLDRVGVLFGRMPLTVSVAFPPSYTSESFFSPMWLVPLAPGSTPSDAPRESAAQLEHWQSAHGVMGQDESLRLTISGTDDRPVILQSITPVVLSRSDPMPGWFTSDRGCGGVDVREARVNLDTDPATVTFDDGETPATPQAALTLQVSRTDVEVIDVVATSHRSTVEWALDITYTSDGRTGTIRVDDNGRPFRMSALADGRAEGYQLSSGRLWRDEGLDPRNDTTGMC